MASLVSLCLKWMSLSTWKVLQRFVKIGKLQVSGAPGLEFDVPALKELTWLNINMSLQVEDENNSKKYHQMCSI